MDIGSARTDAEREATFRFLNEEISSQHQTLLEEARGTDTKATLIAGFAAAALTFLLARRRGPRWIAAVAMYGVALGFAFAALWPRRWDGLWPRALEDRLSEMAPAFVVGRVAGTKVTIFERNHKRAILEAVLWTISVVALATASGLAVWSTIVEEQHEH